MRGILSFVFIFVASIIGGSLQCEEYEIPCENGDCIDFDLWCDSHADCFDGSDEKYCKKSSFLNKDPNKCPSNYFKCDDGSCIPKIARCNEYNNCDDSSDEKNCGEHDSSKSGSTSLPSGTKTTEATTSQTTIRTTSQQPSVHSVSKSTNLDSGAMQHSVEVVFSDLRHAEYSSQRKKALDWLLSKRNSDYGWGDETPRALTALYLSDVQRSLNRNYDDLLMVKQLEVQLSLDMSRNGTKAMKLTDLALYINALLASCKDPKNFYGENLVRTLRNGVDGYHRAAIFVNPSVYLTLCLVNETTFEDARKIHEIFVSGNAAIGRIDIQALTLLAATCIHRNANYLTSPQYDGFRRSFLQKMSSKGIPGNVYEASLLAQVLQELKITLPGLLEFLLKQQEEDGSFGGILATYLTLPVLAGRSFLQIDEHCGQHYSTGLAPIEVLKNAKRRKIHVQYSLKYGFPPEVTETIEMQVAEGITFLDVMRLAQEINPKFRFIIEGNREVPVVFSIGGIPNDAEKGMFWTLHLANNGRVQGDAGRFSPFSGNIKELIPHNGDTFVFWMKSF